MPPSTANNPSGISTTPNAAAASGARDDTNASNRRATLVTQSQRNYTLSWNLCEGEGEDNAGGTVFGDDQSNNSSDDNSLDDITHLGRHVHIDDDTHPSAVAFDNLFILDPAVSNERNSTPPPTLSISSFAEDNASYTPPTMEGFPPTPLFISPPSVPCCFVCGQSNFPGHIRSMPYFY